MALKKFKPVTSSLRGLVQIDKSSLWKGRGVKSLSVGIRKTGGRNNLGRITCRHRGGGHKRLYRIIDFKRNKVGVYATVERFEYDPNRSSFIALVKYEDGEYTYILAPQKLNVGEKIISGVDADIKIGNCLPLSHIPVGSVIHNIEMKPGKGGQLIRAAGTFAQLMGKDNGYAQIKIASGELRLVSLNCCATIGVVSNSDNKNITYGKAFRCDG